MEVAEASEEEDNGGDTEAREADTSEEDGRKGGTIRAKARGKDSGGRAHTRWSGNSRWCRS